jgi:hypothetical protein
MIDDDHISDKTRELPEVQLPVIVYFHCDLDVPGELKSKADEIRYAIESALATDDDPKVRTYTYPEVRLAWKDTWVNGKPHPLTPSDR